MKPLNSISSVLNKSHPDSLWVQNSKDEDLRCTRAHVPPTGERNLHIWCLLLLFSASAKPAVFNKHLFLQYSEGLPEGPVVRDRRMSDTCLSKRISCRGEEIIHAASQAVKHSDSWWLCWGSFSNHTDSGNEGIMSPAWRVTMLDAGKCRWRWNTFRFPLSK